MPRVMSKGEFVAAASRPKRRYSVLKLNPKSEVSLRGAVAAPCYWFERNVAQVRGDGKYIIDRQQATITMVVDGVSAVLFYLQRSCMGACTFAFTLNGVQLANAVRAMRRAGLGGWVSTAASMALENLPEARRGELESPLQKLIRGGKTGGR